MFGFFKRAVAAEPQVEAFVERFVPASKPLFDAAHAEWNQIHDLVVRIKSLPTGPALAAFAQFAEAFLVERGLHIPPQAQQVVDAVLREVAPTPDSAK